MGDCADAACIAVGAKMVFRVCVAKAEANAGATQGDAFWISSSCSFGEERVMSNHITGRVGIRNRAMSNHRNSDGDITGGVRVMIR